METEEQEWFPVPQPFPLPKGKKESNYKSCLNDALLEPGQNQPFNVRLLDSNGFVVKEQVSADFAKWIPPTAKVKTEVDGQFGSGGLLTAGRLTSAGAFKATANGLSGVGRARVIPSAPFEEDLKISS